MAVTVNPVPILRIPKAFLADREVKDFIEQQNTIIWQLRNRTGGNADFIDESQQSTINLTSNTNKNTALINSVKLKEFEILTTTESLTTKKYQIIICRNTIPITVTLDPNAVKDDEVHIKRRGEEITVIGLVDGLSDPVINVLNWSVHYVFDGIDWSGL
jgi:hypothetical protein